MKHLQLFEGFRDDTLKKLKDAKETFKTTKKDLKESYKAELHDCISDVIDNYDVSKTEEDCNEIVMKYTNLF